MAKDELERFEMLAPSHWLQAIDDWRVKQPGVPSRSEAICRLVDHGLQGTPASEALQDRMVAWDVDVARLDEAEKARKGTNTEN